MFNNQNNILHFSDYNRRVEGAVEVRLLDLAEWLEKTRNILPMIGIYENWLRLYIAIALEPHE